MDPGQRRDGLSGSYRMFGVRPDPYRDQNREYYAAVLRKLRCAHFDLKYLIFKRHSLCYSYQILERDMGYQ